MKLKNVQISNFRCFESLSIDLDEQLTVLVAKNGQGKSSVLDAIRIGLWSFVSGFDLARNPASDSANNINIDDIRMLKMSDGQMARQLSPPTQITLTSNSWLYPVDNSLLPLESIPISWSRFRTSEAKGTKTKDDENAKGMKNIASILQNKVRNLNYEPSLSLFVFGYYGTGRLWSQKRLTEKKKKHDASFYMRLFGYRDCLDPSSSYKHFADWFTWISECYWEERFKQEDKGLSPDTHSKWKDTILVVQQAIDDVLQETGWHSLEYSVTHEKSLILKHDEQGILKVEMLSDGIRGVLAMVGDIAYRCIKLNPHLGINAVKETRGIVMIDEVDMHLHPAWQQTILGNLIKAFPKIQFIVTTHSPQVISTVSSHQIRILDDGQVHSAEAGTQGAEASRILRRIFEVDPRPQNEPNTKKLNEYLDLVYADKWNNDDAKKKRDELNAIYQDNEPALTEADLYIENRQWELDIEENS
jgi:predicted ATP-binding protein involved in virulence